MYFQARTRHRTEGVIERTDKKNVQTDCKTYKLKCRDILTCKAKTEGAYWPRVIDSSTCRSTLARLIGYSYCQDVNESQENSEEPEFKDPKATKEIYELVDLIRDVNQMKRGPNEPVHFGTLYMVFYGFKDRKMKLLTLFKVFGEKDESEVYITPDGLLLHDPYEYLDLTDLPYGLLCMPRDCTYHMEYDSAYLPIEFYSVGSTSVKYFSRRHVHLIGHVAKAGYAVGGYRYLLAVATLMLGAECVNAIRMYFQQSKKSNQRLHKGIVKLRKYFGPDFSSENLTSLMASLNEIEKKYADSTSKGFILDVQEALLLHLNAHYSVQRCVEFVSWFFAGSAVFLDGTKTLPVIGKFPIEEIMNRYSLMDFVRIGLDVFQNLCDFIFRIMLESHPSVFTRFKLICTILRFCYEFVNDWLERSDTVVDSSTTKLEPNKDYNRVKYVKAGDIVNGIGASDQVSKIHEGNYYKNIENIIRKININALTDNENANDQERVWLIELTRNGNARFMLSLTDIYKTTETLLAEMRKNAVLHVLQNDCFQITYRNWKFLVAQYKREGISVSIVTCFRLI